MGVGGGFKRNAIKKRHGLHKDVMKGDKNHVVWSIGPERDYMGFLY